jgi:ubiquinone/menaquinone biosynthesis C-methylase UbiE
MRNAVECLPLSLSVLYGCLKISANTSVLNQHRPRLEVAKIRVMTTTTLAGLRRQHESIREEFRKQAPHWARNEITPDLRWVVGRLQLQLSLRVLDVAAGTGLLSQAIAPYVKSVLAADLTPEMIGQARRQAELSETANITFEQAAAEALPHSADAFDMVVTRFSIHHLQEPDVAFREMARVCRPSGKIAVIDLVSPEDEDLAARYNSLERLRDPSHTRALSPGQLQAALEEEGVRIVDYFTREVQMNAHDWLDFTQTEPASRNRILDAFKAELSGMGETGFRPFLDHERLMFIHTWGIVIGEKLRR